MTARSAEPPAGATRTGAFKDGADRWSVVEDAYQTMLDAARRPARSKSLANVWGAICHLRDAGCEITVAAVARRCLLGGAEGPKAQSIRNDPDGLQRLVTLAADCGTASARRPRAGGAKGDLPDRVGNPQAAAEVRVLLAERDALERKCNALSGSHRRVGAIGRLTEEMAREKVETLAELKARVEQRPAAGGLRFGPAEGTAVADLVRMLASMGLEFDPGSGELYRMSSSGPIREVKGDIRSVLRAVMSAALSSGVPSDLPEAFRDAPASRVA